MPLCVKIPPSLVIYNPQRSKDIAVHRHSLPALQHLYGTHRFLLGLPTPFLSPSVMKTIFQVFLLNMPHLLCLSLAISGNYALVNFKVIILLWTSVWTVAPIVVWWSLKCSQWCGSVFWGRLVRLRPRFTLTKAFGTSPVSLILVCFGMWDENSAFV